jgi:hypothetical protein
MKKVYRACSYLELETLFTTGKVKSFQDNEGAISCTLDYSFARRIITNSCLTFLNNDSKYEKQMQAFMVTFDFKKLNNPIEVIYDNEWLENHNDIRNHIFGGYVYDEEEEYDANGMLIDDTMKRSIEVFSEEREVIVFNHRMIDGMIVKIQSQNQDLLDKLDRIYTKAGYTSYIEFSNFI